MTLPGKVHGELVKLYYKNGMNVAEVLLVYRRNHLQKRGPCTSQGLRDLIKKIEGTGCNSNKPRLGLPIVSKDIVT